MHHPLRFALVGCGTIADTHAKALTALPDDVRFTTCCDVDGTRAEAFARAHRLVARPWADVLADPEIDAITICTPSGHHGALAIEALRAGKHVMVEKPMEVSRAVCVAMVGAARAANRKLGVISQHRFDPATLAAHAEIDRGTLGPLLLVDAKIPWFRAQSYYDSAEWRGTLAVDGGGCLINQGIHTVDLLLGLAGPVTRVHAVMRTAAHERIEVEDSVCATLEFASGAIGSLLCSTAAYPGFPARLAVHGHAGSIVIEGDELQCLAIKGRETVRSDGLSAHALQVAGGGTRSAVREGESQALGEGRWVWGDAHRAQFADFCAAVREGRSPLSDGEAGLAAVALVEAIYTSAR